MQIRVSRPVAEVVMTIFQMCCITPTKKDLVQIWFNGQMHVQVSGRNQIIRSNIYTGWELGEPWPKNIVTSFRGSNFVSLMKSQPMMDEKGSYYLISIDESQILLKTKDKTIRSAPPDWESGEPDIELTQTETTKVTKKLWFSMAEIIINEPI